MLYFLFKPDKLRGVTDYPLKRSYALVTCMATRNAGHTCYHNTTLAKGKTTNQKGLLLLARNSYRPLPLKKLRPRNANNTNKNIKISILYYKGIIDTIN